RVRGGRGRAATRAGPAGGPPRAPPACARGRGGAPIASRTSASSKRVARRDHSRAGEPPLGRVAFTCNTYLASGSPSLLRSYLQILRTRFASARTRRVFNIVFLF